MSALCPPWLRYFRSESAPRAVFLHQPRDRWRRRLAVVDFLHVGENDAARCQHCVLPGCGILLSWRPDHQGNHMTGTRNGAIGRAEKYFDDGGFLEELQRRGGIPPPPPESDPVPAL